MILYMFLAGCLCYWCSAFISNSPKIQAHSWYLPLGLTISLIANTLWLTIAKKTGDPHNRFLYGLYWDAMIVSSYAVIPMLLYHIKLSRLEILGLILLIVGMILTKVG